MWSGIQAGVENCAPERTLEKKTVVVVAGRVG